MNREELAWAAGFFDGEGSLGLFLSPKGHGHIRLTVGQTDRPMLERFNTAIGGLGRISGPTLKDRRKPFWTLNVSGFEGVQAVIAFLWMWMSGPKRAQARTTLEESQQYFKTVRKYTPRSRKRVAA